MINYYYNKEWPCWKKSADISADISAYLSVDISADLSGDISADISAEVMAQNISWYIKKSKLKKILYLVILHS